VVVAATALALLFTAHPQRRPLHAAPTPTGSPSPAPLFDRRPGRTPIPAPVQTGDLLSGLLPFTGPPSRNAATRATNLVLGRYCSDPSRYGLTIEPYTEDRSIGFDHVDVVVVDRVLTDSGTEMQLSLTWDGSAYRWFGPLSLVNGC